MPDLQTVEGVAVTDRVDASHEGVWEIGAEPEAEELTQGRHVEGPHVEDPAGWFGGGPQKPEGILRARGHPQRGQNPDGFRPKPADGEGEHLGGCGIDPLDVVDRQQDGPGLAERAQQSRRRQGDREPIRTHVADPEERCIDRLALRFGKFVTRLLEYIGEQVPEGREGHPGLGLDRSRGKNPVSRARPGLDAAEPHRCLTDAGLPSHQQDRG